MRVLKYLMKSANLLNIILAAVLVVIMIKILFPLFSVVPRYVPPKMTVVKSTEEEHTADKLSSLAQSDFSVIGEMNLFHPERLTPAGKAGIEIPKPELILYGTTVSDSFQAAFVEDKKNPQTSPGRGNRQITLKKDETIGGYTVTEIGTDRIVLMKGDDRIIVTISDSVKKRETTASTLTTPAKGQSAQAKPSATVPGAGRATPTPAAPARPVQPMGQTRGVTTPGANQSTPVPQPLQQPISRGSAIVPDNPVAP